MTEIYTKTFQGGKAGVGYRWRSNLDVDEAVVVVMNSLDKEDELQEWLVRTLGQSIADSNPEFGKYFLEEIRHHAPLAMKYFEVNEG